MYYVYVLLSELDGNFYTGACVDLRKRLKSHYDGQVASTRNWRPLRLIYYEACLSKEDAFRREKYLKSGMSKRYLCNRLQGYL